MKLKTYLVALGLICSSGVVALADSASTTTAPAPASGVDQDIRTVREKIMTKIRAGEKSAQDLAPEIADFDALIEKYKGSADDAGKAYLMKASLYGQVIGDSATMKSVLNDLKAAYPQSKAAGDADRMLASMEASAKAQAVADGLVGKQAPGINFIWSTDSGLKTLADLKGKVVVLDFWATWCGPCIASFPHMRDMVEKYKDSPVAFVGVTSIQGFVANLEGGKVDTKGDPAREEALLKDFIKQKDMTWTVAVSDENVFNPAYGVRGIPCVVIIAPDGTVRQSGLNPHPQSQKPVKTEYIDDILKEFHLKAPVVAKN